MSKGYIVYVGSVTFPSQSAASRRILGNLRCFQELGYQTVVLSSGAGNDSEEDFEGIRVINLNERTNEKLPRLLKHLSYFDAGKKAIKWLKQNEKDIAAVVLYSGYSPYLLRLLPWSSKSKIPLVFDAVEWYDPKTIFNYLIDPYYWNIELAMRVLIKRTKNVIAISSFLSDYYKENGCNTVIIPPLIDIRDISPNLQPNKELLIVSYTGNPGRKDLFNNYLEAVNMIYNKNKRIEFRIAGILDADLLKFKFFKDNGFRSVPSYIKNYGRVSFEKSLEITKNSDFSFLQRPYLRSTKAGFPTKFVESMALGTPTILNITSDLGDYVIDGHNSIVCDNESAEALVIALEKAEKLGLNEKMEMRNNCRILAENSFHYENYIDKIKYFLDHVK
ncbi:hypothetical protein KO02_22575 [Sphingobacterium sp. ML3W]|uniref:glycosyltransferase n=1 Tax=Sphingobacterium sp. ML3W TaxID=1538644 RepID=UPI0004F70914|nr:glycosyltransferase [Sphingobacterium sp. ML3W]AIM39154.1 hypothetical protein KO02_22575 [Sphingobacterium sp. ML3W]